MNAYPIDISVKPEVEAFFDPATNTISYVVKDPSSNACAVIDSVMDIDYAAGRITYANLEAERILGLGRSGLATAAALQAGGAEPLLWDDSPEARAQNRRIELKLTER